MNQRPLYSILKLLAHSKWLFHSTQQLLLFWQAFLSCIFMISCTIHARFCHVQYNCAVYNRIGVYIAHCFYRPSQVTSCYNVFDRIAERYIELNYSQHTEIIARTQKSNFKHVSVSREGGCCNPRKPQGQLTLLTCEVDRRGLWKQFLAQYISSKLNYALSTGKGIVCVFEINEEHQPLLCIRTFIRNH